MKKIIIVVLAIIAFVLSGIFVFSLINGSDSKTQSQQSVSSQSNQAETQQVSTEQPTQETTYTLDEVTKRNSKDDCWTVIDGVVYDITSYISRHPGGNNILSACGTDGTEFFYGQRAGASGGRENHRSNRQATNELARLRKGSLAQ